ncbi:hypothetical protein BKA58DRAFT_323355 [Alternaria rosae]|uniref:uncharacterized protein n=1 Tax=Alternaria rosae TaxID=1187941 RepID=UPI001E8E17F3|nr:uncharacterized protein BKA58DRAFT_323355 [Alternaria rosae]KAH6860699.1 hypothetical protein BKA58DRAFT_323355 [Alternaria rosae]
MSFAYKVDELLALRDSVSESAVSIEKFPDEDVIREHVLRPSASASANLPSRASNRSLRVPTPANLVPFGPHKRPSPTPSIKRGKAEKLLKEHGSPPGIRVTAGGRIVPSDLLPLGTSRYGDATYRPPQPPLRVAPGSVMQAPTHQNSNNTARIEVVGGQPVIFIGDRMFALPAVNASNPTMPPTGPAAMDPIGKQTQDPSTMTTHCALSGAAFGPPRSNTHTPFAGLDLATLKTQQALKKQELRTVEQTEVLQAGQQSEAWRAGMIEKKRCLIVELDALRKQITAVESDSSTTQHGAFSGANGAGSTAMSPFGAQFQQPFAPPMYPFAAPYPPMPMYQPQPQPFGTLSAFSAEPPPFVPTATNPPHSPPGSANRRSRAIEIKPPPPEEVKKGSALNPKSPTYEPVMKSGTTHGTVSPTPSLEKRSPWRGQQIPVAGKHDRRMSSQKHSLSSVDTMDFFPTNTHEHSSTRVAPQIKEVEQSSNENTAVPSTPEKHWPASPWNEGDSGRSRTNDVAPKLTSWPEAFGKQPSLHSMRQGLLEQPLSTMIDRAPVMGANMSVSASSSNMAPRTSSTQCTGTDENWPFHGKPVTHVPSTYQEGYQAGYDHVGIPDSPEVLQGYIQGLLHFLTDESKKRQAEYRRGTDSRTPSLRGLVAGSLPHNSDVEMTFNYNNASGGQENIPNRVASVTQYLNPPVMFPQRMTGMQDKGIVSRVDTTPNGGVSNQSFGNQTQNRSYSTSLNMQRFYPTPKELSPSEIGGYSAPAPRHFANQRLSGLDGAMDDLSEMINDTHIEERRSSVAVDSRSAEAPMTVEYEESNASCFKVSSSKSKQKAPSSPAKASDIERGTEASSPANPASSPKKSGEHSPAKAKLEQVTNKFRRSKKDDPRTMSPDERKTRSDKWRQRFQQLKRTEIDEIEAHRRNSRT